MPGNHLHEVKTAWVLGVRDQRHSILEEKHNEKAGSGFRKKMGHVSHVIIFTLPRTVLVAELEH